MKKIIIPLLALLMSIPLTAQEKFEVRLGWGGYPLVDEVYVIDSSWDDKHYPAYIDTGDLGSIYGAQVGSIYMTGQIFGEFSWNVRKKLSLAGGLYFNGIYGSIVDPDTTEPIRRTHGVSATLLPTVYWYWANYPKCRLYSSAGLGITVKGYDGLSMATPAFQMTAIGFTAGKKVFFFAEYCVGTLCMGGKAGLGYRL